MNRKRRKVIVEVEPPLKVKVKRFLESKGIYTYFVYLSIVVLFVGIYILALHFYWKHQAEAHGFSWLFDW